MANPPMLTPEQRQRALEKAGAARRQRAEVKDKLKIGSLSLGELFEATDRGDESGNMLAKLKVVSVLESLPGVGKVNAKRLLRGLDISDGRRPQRAQELDAAFHRWALSPRRPDDAAIEALVKVDLARAVEPARLVEFQKKNLDDEIEAYRKQQPDARPPAVREKIEIAHGKAMGGLEIMEEEIQKEFRRRLDRTVGPKGASSSLVGRWTAAVARQFDLQIRRPLDQVFVEKLK